MYIVYVRVHMLYINFNHTQDTHVYMYVHAHIHTWTVQTHINFSECILMHLFLVATDFLILDLKLHTVKTLSINICITHIITLHMYIHALILHVHVCTSQTTCTCTLIYMP